MTPATRSLLRAAATGDIALIRGLLAQGTDVNCVTAAGQTPLMLAAGFNHEEAVTVLLEAGAFLHAQDELGLTALDWARNFTNLRELINAAINATSERTVESTNAGADTTPAATIPATTPPAQTTPTKPAQTIIKPFDIPEDTRASRVTLGGLAGAILRERVAKTTGTTHRAADASRDPELSQVLPETATETTFQSNGEYFEPESAETTKPLPTISSESREPPAEAISVDVDSTRDYPIRQTKESRFDTSPLTAFAANEESPTTNTQSRDQPFERTKRLSKVEVQVPSFKPMPTANKRPFVWVLVIVFLTGAAFAGFQLSRYLLARQTGTARPAITTNPNAQTTPAPVKSSPIVGGNLIGTDLFVPDAEYPSEGNGQSGNVVVQVRVNQRGIVLSAKATEGPESLRSAAERAAKVAAFSSAKLRGKGRLVSGTITYSFVPPQPVAQSPGADNTQPSTATSSGAAQAAQSTGADNLPSVGGPLFGAALKLPQPDYPNEAKNEGVTGTVTVVVRVNRAGRVVSWRTLDGDNRLRAAALKAARQATFSPAKLRGNDEVVGTITYTFGSRSVRQGQ